MHKILTLDIGPYLPHTLHTFNSYPREEKRLDVAPLVINSSTVDLVFEALSDHVGIPFFQITPPTPPQPFFLFLFLGFCFCFNDSVTHLLMKLLWL